MGNFQSIFHLIYRNRISIRNALSIFVLIGTVLVYFQNCSNVSFSSQQKENNTAQCVAPCPGPSPTATNPTLMADAKVFKFGPQSNAIDILIVDDNSGSMSIEQTALGASFNNFIGGLNGVDWQIGVTSTDTEGNSGSTRNGNTSFPSNNGTFNGPADLWLVNKQDPSTVIGPNFKIAPMATAASVFQTIIQRTDSQGHYLGGTGDERGIFAANLSVLGSNNANVTQGFFRPNANLAIVILSDEDERSCGGDAKNGVIVDSNGLINANGTSTCDANGNGQYTTLTVDDQPETLLSNISKQFNGTKNVIVNSIIVKPGDIACLYQENDLNADGTKLIAEGTTPGSGLGNGGKYGEVYSKLSAMTGGSAYSICDVTQPGAFAADLQNMSNSFAANVNPQTLALPYSPVGAISITYSPADPTLSCVQSTMNAMQVICNKYPANTTITVSYNHY